MKYEIKGVNIWSFAKFLAVLGLIIGFFIGLIAAILFSVLGSLAINTAVIGTYGIPFDLTGIGAFAAIVMLIIYPIFLGIIGLIGGLITGFIYNVVSGIIGGIQVELTEGTVLVPESQAMAKKKN